VLIHWPIPRQLFHNVDWSLKKSWGAAREDCVSRRADLLSVQSQDEEQFLALYSKGSSKWIGLKHNPTEGGEERLRPTERPPGGGGHTQKTKTKLTILPPPPSSP